MLVTLRAQRIHGQTFSSVWRLAFTLKTSASISSTIFKHCDTCSTIFFFSLLAGDARISVLHVKEEPL